MSEKFVITIERQYGSGGREIGEIVAKTLGIKAYDHELIQLAAQKSGMNPDMLRQADEVATSSLLYTLAIGASVHGTAPYGFDVPINDKLFMTQSEIIKEISEKESCVIIGRCADYVLRNHPHLISVFIYADVGEKIKRICQRQDCDETRAKELISRTDKRRINYYNFYTGKKWGKFDNYTLSVNSSLLGIEGTANIISDLAKQYLN